MSLEQSRGEYVRDNGNKGHLGAWHRAEDWTADGNLIATGEARLKAIDPWANDRAAGRPCPVLGSPGMPHWSDYVDTKPVHAVDVDTVVDTNVDSRAEYKRRWMAAKRAKDAAAEKSA